jgi:large subunit ribosomal protein L12
VIKATGVNPDDVKVKSLVAAMSEVNIEDALKAAPIAAAAAAPAAAAPAAGTSTAGAADNKEDEKKDEKKEEEALEGLSSLFG